MRKSKTVRVGYCSGLVKAIRCRPTLCSCSQIINILCCSSKVNSTAESKRVTWINYWVGEVCAYFACRAAPCHVAPAVLTQVTAEHGDPPQRTEQTDRSPTSSTAAAMRRKGRLDSETLCRRVWLEPYSVPLGQQLSS
jgi:hypothetical protein